VFVSPGFDVRGGLGVLVRLSDIDIDVGDNSVSGRDFEVLAGDVPVTGGGEDVGARSGIFNGRDFKAGHSSLKSVDWVGLNDENAGTVRPQTFGALGCIRQNVYTCGR